MGFLDGWISPPRADHVHIAKYIVVIVSLFFISYIGTLFGSVLFSLGFSARGKSEDNPLFLRFSRDLADTFTGNIGAATVLGVLPVITLLICFGQILYGTAVNIGQYFTILLIFVVLSAIAAQVYKNSFEKRDTSTLLHYGSGAVTLLLLLHVLLSFSSTMSFILFPEEWPINKEIIPVMFDWNVLARLHFLLTFSLALTGGAIIFFFFNWMGGKEDVKGGYADYVRKFGSGVALAFTIIQAPFLLWTLGTLPFSAKSYSLYAVALVAMFVLFLISYLLYASLRDAEVRYGSWVFGFFMIFFVAFLVNDNIARENALVYQNYALDKIETDIRQQIQAQREERSGATVASVELGEQIFNTKCVACHQFDQKVVGPPYLEVMPKYVGDVEKLKGFILNPVKVNPEYIAMPALGLKPHEAESAAMFLLQKYDELTKQ